MFREKRAKNQILFILITLHRLIDNQELNPCLSSAYDSSISLKESLIWD